MWQIGYDLAELCRRRGTIKLRRIMLSRSQGTLHIFLPSLLLQAITLSRYERSHIAINLSQRNRDFYPKNIILIQLSLTTFGDTTSTTLVAGRIRSPEATFVSFYHRQCIFVLCAANSCVTNAARHTDLDFTNTVL